MLKRISAFIESLIRRGPTEPPKSFFGVIEHDASRLRLIRTLNDGSKRVNEAEWREVSRVVVYKRDALTHDVIALAFLMSGREGIDVNEAMEGWDDFVEKLPEYLPGCQTLGQWFQAVAFPAFALNPTEIFRREEPAPEEAETRTEGQAEAQTEAQAEGDGLS
jgi:hypothetical protein